MVRYNLIVICNCCGREYNKAQEFIMRGYCDACALAGCYLTPEDCPKNPLNQLQVCR